MLALFGALLDEVFDQLGKFLPDIADERLPAMKEHPQILKCQEHDRNQGSKCDKRGRRHNPSRSSSYRRSDRGGPERDKRNHRPRVCNCDCCKRTDDKRGEQLPPGDHEVERTPHQIQTDPDGLDCSSDAPHYRAQALSYQFSVCLDPPDHGI